MTSHLTGTNKVLVSTETAGLRMPNISPAAVWSFLKDTRGDVTWPIEQMAKTLNISVAAAKCVLALLRLQGYVQTSEDNSEWMTTAAGEEVSGSKMPRYSTERVENALIAMSELCKSFNQDKKSAFIIKNAIAFGDFLGDRQRYKPPMSALNWLPKPPGRVLQSEMNLIFSNTLNTKAGSLRSGDMNHGCGNGRTAIFCSLNCLKW